MHRRRPSALACLLTLGACAATPAEPAPAVSADRVQRLHERIGAELPMPAGVWRFVGLAEPLPDKPALLAVFEGPTTVGDWHHFSDLRIVPLERDADADHLLARMGGGPEPSTGGLSGRYRRIVVDGR